MEARINSHLIEPWMLVQTVFDRWPVAIPVFIQHRMHCVGCQMAAFNTLEDAVRVHGVPLEPFLTDLQLAVQLSDPGGQASGPP